MIHLFRGIYKCDRLSVLFTPFLYFFFKVSMRIINELYYFSEKSSFGISNRKIWSLCTDKTDLQFEKHNIKDFFVFWKQFRLMKGENNFSHETELLTAYYCDKKDGWQRCAAREECPPMFAFFDFVKDVICLALLCSLKELHQ